MVFRTMSRLLSASGRHARILLPLGVVAALLLPSNGAFFKPAIKEVHVENHILTIIPPVVTAMISLFLFFTIDWVRPLTTLMVMP